MAMVEEEIIHLGRKVEELRFSLRGEKKRTEELKLRHRERYYWLRQRRRRGSSSFFHRLGRPKDVGAEAERCRHSLASETSPSSSRRPLIEGRRTSTNISAVSSNVSETDLALLHTSSDHDVDVERIILSKHVNPDQRKNPRPAATKSDPADDQNSWMEEIMIFTPNELSEELIRCLISIFHRLNQQISTTGSTAGSSYCINNSSARVICHDSHASTISSSSKLISLSCMSSKGGGITSSKSTLMNLLLGEMNIRGPYKNFVSVTESSLDMSRISHCFLSIRRLRVLMQKLCTVDLTFLTYKQKLAFWINIYNACIMNAFLRHELPSSSDKVLALLNRAAINVGGIILNALAIEHFILRHPCNSKPAGIVDEKEALLRDTYGLSYPEPHVTFALCRGTWSSPALRIYTGDNVVDQLERAKTEYLETCVRITHKKRILLPKLLYWHMKDFADDVESLVEWIYSQLPRSGSLKKLAIMECLQKGAGVTKQLPVAEMVQVQPYESEFRYLLPFRPGL